MVGRLFGSSQPNQRMSDENAVMLEEEDVRVTFTVPEGIRDGAKRRLPHGGMSEELRGTLRRIAHGEDMNQRSRLEKQKRDLKKELRDEREKHRDAGANIETLEDRIQGINDELEGLSAKEDRYEAKLENVEYDLRIDGMRLWSDHPAVTDVAAEVGKTGEGVIKDLKHRNPDVPDHAFKQGNVGTKDYTPVDTAKDKYGLKSMGGDSDGDGEITPLEDREEEYRAKNPDKDE